MDIVSNLVRCRLADESVGKPDSVRSLPTVAIIHLRPLSPAAWCDLPGGSGEQPSKRLRRRAYASF
jgi:hypothetical protein